MSPFDIVCFLVGWACGMTLDFVLSKPRPR